MPDNVDITKLAKIGQETLVELKAVRRELADVRALSLQTVEYLRSLEKRHDSRFVTIDLRFSAVDERIAAVDQRLAGVEQSVSDVKNEIELIIRAEVSGRLTNFENRIDERLARIERRLVSGAATE